MASVQFQLKAVLNSCFKAGERWSWFYIVRQSK